MSHKILVADDDPFIRVFLQKQLTNAGYTVTIAENGAEGFAKAKADTPDIIVSDWTMPEMDGVEFCHAVRNDETLRYSYFILLTAKDDYEEKIKVMNHILFDVHHLSGNTTNYYAPQNCFINKRILTLT